MATSVRRPPGNRKVNPRSTELLVLRAQVLPALPHRELLEDTALAYLTACRHIRNMARRSKISNRYLLHHLVYRDLVTSADGTPDGASPVATPIPSQLAIRACLRVIGQLRSAKGHEPDPFPHRCIDFDSKSLTYDPQHQLLRLTTLLSIGQRGHPAQQARLRVPIRFASTADRRAFETASLVGAHLIIPKDRTAPLILVARLLPAPVAQANRPRKPPVSKKK